MGPAEGLTSRRCIVSSEKTTGAKLSEMQAAKKAKSEELIQMMMDNLTFNNADEARLNAIDDERYAREVANATPVTGPAGGSKHHIANKAPSGK